MINSLGQPQSVLVLGGTSDIGMATLRAWSRTCRPYVVLAARPGPRRDHALAEVRGLGLEVEAVDFDAEDTDAHPDLIRSVAGQRDIDVALVAFGLLGDEERAWQDHAAAVELARVNYVGAVSVGVVLAEVMQQQGHGSIVVLSSVAGERVRRSNFVYGSTKAGMDGFYLGLGEAVRDAGVHVAVVRPGFVRTRMTEGREAAPLAVDADDVAAAIVRAVAERRELVWVPGPLRAVMSGLRHVPRPLFRRLPL
ncbi:decaprenylphospho-beta-D-erythro-pentofuranosid-2-ulose 2-reductase [Nocardioides guangzhouensis]|uniref:Decaprenylphospho-beta-D-erythro-pentofuranosid-2-ulose 2-reductase n=1 Tax=Nocardioides guangzhouensis TaxID=2497878 RepID=A0A4Q4ZAL1_9ACTN|nr:decaprenylphospho-beta-D-erythro-pentofuranosid-2-ulose 2-reductase [Nocardioides guangzhouensis]RYP84943.1 decaprenylphospho-beta-D-erythro-pentofuranosid-2-ulose 2-reductase [Nocardioides guangzhouensis]